MPEVSQDPPPKASAKASAPLISAPLFLHLEGAKRLSMSSPDPSAHSSSPDPSAPDPSSDAAAPDPSAASVSAPDPPSSATSPLIEIRI